MLDILELAEEMFKLNGLKNLSQRNNIISNITRIDLFRRRYTIGLFHWNGETIHKNTTDGEIKVMTISIIKTTLIIINLWIIILTIITTIMIWVKISTIWRWNTMFLKWIIITTEFNNFLSQKLFKLLELHSLKLNILLMPVYLNKLILRNFLLWKLKNLFSRC